MLLQKDSADVLSGGIGAAAYSIINRAINEAMERDSTATEPVKPRRKEGFTMWLLLIIAFPLAVLAEVLRLTK